MWNERKAQYESIQKRKLSYWSNRPAEMGVPRRLLYFGLLMILVSYIYTLHTRNKSKDAFTAEQAVLNSWNKLIEFPSVEFRKVVVGINSNVDLIIPGTQLLRALNVTPGIAVHHDKINSLQELQETFSDFFSKGADAERYTANADVYHMMVSAAEKLKGAVFFVGGNAALMAQKIASSYTKAKVLLVGPIGPRLRTLLHPNIVTQNSTRITKDEIHVIMEYKQGEIWGDHVSPLSSRFITSHDTLSSSSIVIDMFFNTIINYKPDLVILSGMHLLSQQPQELWQEKLKTIKRNLSNISKLIPIHLELGSMSDSEYAKNLMHKILPFVDSLGLNEQELTFLSHLGGGPHGELFPLQGGRSLHAHKVTDMLYWLIQTFGRDRANVDSKKYNFRLQRIHFHCLTYHMLVNKGPEWSNTAAAVAAGAKVAGKQACGANAKEVDSDSVELRINEEFLLDKVSGKNYHFTPHNPMTSWMRDGVLFIFTPVLVCKQPYRTVGMSDVISATSLMYSQFYRFDK